MKLRIDAEFQALIPPLAAAELDQLTANIIAEGCRDPLVHWKGVLIDGHNRHRICTEHGVAFQMVEREFADRNDCMIWIIRNQFGRRNLTSGQRIELGIKLEPLIAAQAKEQQIRKPDSVLQISAKQNPIHTNVEIAKAAGVSHDTVHKYKTLLAKAEPETLDKVRTGEVSINNAFQDIRRADLEAKREARRDENRAKIAATPALPTNAKFATITMDPPWALEDDNAFGRASPDFGLMDVPALAALPVERLADVDCHLYCWITNRMLPHGFQLFEKWGFRYVGCLTWCKPSIGIGTYFRGSTEHVLFGVRGSQMLKRKDIGTWFAAPRGPDGHSSKPPSFYDLVENCSPGPYLEMFSRTERKGWSMWGADA